MKRKRILGIVAFTVSLLFTTVLISNAEASKCYRFYYDPECYNFNYTLWDYYRVALHIDGSFDDEFGDWGYWEYYGSSMHLSYWSDSTECYPMIAGTKKQGFYKCTDGYWWGPEWPGCWYMKKVKLYECGFSSPLKLEEGRESKPVESGSKDFRR